MLDKGNIQYTQRETVPLHNSPLTSRIMPGVVRTSRRDATCEFCILSPTIAHISFCKWLSELSVGWINMYITKLIIDFVKRYLFMCSDVQFYHHHVLRHSNRIYQITGKTTLQRNGGSNLESRQYEKKYI